MSEKPQGRAAVRCDARKRLPHLMGNRCCHRFEVHELVVSFTLQLRDRSAELVCALTQLGDQSRIFNSDDGLIGEGGGEFDLLRREGIDARSGSNKNAYQRVIAEERNAE